MITSPRRGAARKAGAAGRMSLTRRGRFVFIGLPVLAGTAALLAVAIVFLMPSTVHATTEPAGPPATRTVTVQPRESLWEIAHGADPQRDTREVIDDIVELNDLSTSVLSGGQLLEVPAS